MPTTKAMTRPCISTSPPADDADEDDAEQAPPTPEELTPHEGNTLQVPLLMLSWEHVRNSTRTS